MSLFFKLINQLKANKIFKFISSVKLAVPLMLIVGGAVAYGTIVESRYNAEMAKMFVYQAWWFQILLCLLWINIFTSTISRIPYKMHHLGFVITHLGLLTLLVGAMVTSQYGIDGQLRIVEAKSNDTIVLPDLVFEMATPESEQAESYNFVRQPYEMSGGKLDFLNNRVADRIVILKYAPFVSVTSQFRQQTSGEHGSALGFILKNAFFNESEWLHSKEKSEIQLGPAHLRIIEHQSFESSGAATQRVTKVLPISSTPQKSRKTSAQKLEIEVHKKSNNEVLSHIDFEKLKKAPVKIGKYLISLKKQYQQATVAQGGLSEGGELGKNPALEIEISDGPNKQREVLYAKFPNFSLHADGVFGMNFVFISPGAETQALEPNSSSPHGGPSSVVPAQVNSDPSPMGGGNEIEFHTYRDHADKVRIVLYKNRQVVLAQWAVPGEVVQTPWMGMTITIGTIQMNSTNESVVTPIEHPLRSNLPPAGLQVKLPGDSESKSFWLVEGEPKRLSHGGHEFEVYFGRKTLKLPFSVQLEKFYKKDYPGTQTPISYESDVHVNNLPGKIKIAMNEPLKFNEFVLYQSSYELNPGQPPASIFSVNQDPGRSIKYTGSLILVLGIIIFTVARSSKFKKWRKPA